MEIRYNLCMIQTTGRSHLLDKQRLNQVLLYVAGMVIGMTIGLIVFAPLFDDMVLRIVMGIALGVTTGCSLQPLAPKIKL